MLPHHPLVLLTAAALLGAPPDDASPARPGAAPAVEQERASSTAGPGEVAVHEALERGLAFLATQQDLEPDGSFPAGRKETYAPVGITALAALAFMAGGSTPRRGPYREEVRQAVEYLLSRSSDDLAPGYIRDEADGHSRMHGHGLATLALAQAYDSSPSSGLGQRIAKTLEAAVRCIEGSQSLEGGWYYYPDNKTDHEGSITVCVVQALRAARNAGILVDKGVIDRAIDYVQRLQQEDGGFAYSLHQTEQVSIALTAACLSTLHATGIYDGAVVDRGYDWLWRELAARDEARRLGSVTLEARFPFYERFYLMQTLWQHRDPKVFERWFAEEVVRVVREQKENGSWVDRRHERGLPQEGMYGSSYSTAMNCLFLALPDGLLPIFQR